MKHNFNKHNCKKDNGVTAISRAEESTTSSTSHTKVQIGSVEKEEEMTVLKMLIPLSERKISTIYYI